MSEHEFDSYLALLSGMLGLSKVQRESISGELRDHMLERMHALVAAGVPRDEAVAKALEEFGDASRLASGLAAAAAIERRRQIMRWTVGTLSTFGLLLFVALIFWPSGENGSVVQNAHAQDAAEPEEVSVFATTVIREKIDDPNEITFAKLQQTCQLEFIDTPLSEVIATVQEDHGIQMFLDLQGLEEIGINSDEPVTFAIRGVPTMLALDLILGQLDLGITIREGVVIVTNRDLEQVHLLVRCYAVDDLVDVHTLSPAEQLSTIVGRIRGLANQRRTLLASGVQEKIERGKALETSIISFADQIPFVRDNFSGGVVSLITTTIDVDSWEELGGPGTIQLVGTTLVVKNSVLTHWKIENFLARLRRALNEQPKSVARWSSGATPRPTLDFDLPIRTPAKPTKPVPPLEPADENPFSDAPGGPQPESAPSANDNPFSDVPSTPQPTLKPKTDDPFGF